MNIRKLEGKRDIDNMIIFAIMFLIQFAESLIKKLEDKHLTWGERFALISELKPLLEIIKDWRKLIEEIKTLQKDEAEIDNIVSIVRDELDLPNEKLKIRVVKATDLLLSIYSFIGEF